MKIRFKHDIKQGDKVSNEQIIDMILKHRDIKDIDTFLNPPSPLTIDIVDFYEHKERIKKQIKETLKMLEEIKKSKRMIVVYTDYDADGITGGSILWETLHLLGFNVMPYVPHRKLEGYGFSIKGIDTIKKQFNPALIISVDHGITAKDKITYAKKLGIPIIVTDHHLEPEHLPTDAFAIFHISALSGSGVSYFFSKLIFDHFQTVPSPYTTSQVKKLAENFRTDYLALASIGTVADLVPLTGPSRSIVKYGLAAFSNIKRPGINHILKEAGIEGKPITPYEIGFIIAPRINAIGRLEHAIDALRLLCTTSDSKAYELASKVGDLNKNRQDLVEKSLKEAHQMLKKDLNPQNSLTRNKLIVLISDHWHEGIIGLIASKITEEYYRPTIVMTKADGFYKGSARSIPSFHITDFLRSMKNYLIDVGGHKGAAGFTISKTKLNDFITIVTKSSEKLIKDKDLEKVIEADIKIPLSKITVHLARILEKLQPFGIGNPQPVFLSTGMLSDMKILGKNNNHLKLSVKTPDSFPIEMLSFNNADQFKTLSKNQQIECVYSLMINNWKYRETVQGRLLVINIFPDRSL